ncbi:hypothetical protein COOONC_13438, partial [Cooperia oncophora]
KSVRRGKRSVASLRARFQRKFCGHCVDKTNESSENCEPLVTVDNMEQDRLIPPMRQGMCTSDGPPPLPANPPPLLPDDSPYLSSSLKTKTVASSPITLKLLHPGPPPQSSPQSYNESEAFASMRLTSESPESQTTTVRKVAPSTATTKPTQSSTPKFSPSPVLEPTIIPKKPPRAMSLTAAEQSPNPANVPQGILVKHSKRPSSGATMPPEKFDYKVTSTKKAVIQESAPSTRRRDTVRFSISSDLSMEDYGMDSTLSESTQSVRMEDLPADTTQHSEHQDQIDSLVGEDEDWWQHSHAA